MNFTDLGNEGNPCLIRHVTTQEVASDAARVDVGFGVRLGVVYSIQRHAELLSSAVETRLQNEILNEGYVQIIPFTILLPVGFFAVLDEISGRVSSPSPSSLTKNGSRVALVLATRSACEARSPPENARVDQFK